MWLFLRVKLRRLQIRIGRKGGFVWAFCWGYVCLLMLFSVIGDRGLWSSYRLWREKQRLTTSIQNLTNEIAHLRQDVDRFLHDPRTIEKYAREELKLYGEGEIHYIFH